MTIKETLNFNVPITKYCKLVKEAWDITKEDEKKEKKEREDVFNDRLNIVSRFRDKIHEEAGELMDFCFPLICANRSTTLDDFYKEMGDIKTDELLYREKKEKWMSCYKLFRSCYDKVLFYEENERKGLCKYILHGQTVFRETTVNGETVSYVESSPINPNFALIGYCKYKEEYEYKFCHELCKYINNKLKNGERVRGLLASFLLTVRLYIALKNEEEKIRLFSDIFIPKSDQAPQTTTPAPQAKKVELPPVLDTEEGRELLQKVINAGFCDENYNWDETKWPDGDDLYGLVYFVEKANRVLKLQKEQKNGRFYSWKPFDTLFTYRGKMARKDDKTQLQIIRKNHVRYQSNKKRFDPKQSVKDKIDPLFS